jgi:hypothetical protein
MHRAHFESFFHDPKYWARYLDTLAENRFNTFVLIFGYENGGYFAPPYPYFFDVAGFDDVRVVGITPQQQRRNLDSLNRLIRMAHERGLRFTVGIWDHIYRGGVQGPSEHARKPTQGLVWGLKPDNLVPYTQAALRKFLQAVGELDGLQFRMHGESGLKRQEMQAFWPGIYRIVQEVRPGIRFDARAKELPDSLIDQAAATGVNLRICTKYWAEQMGLPFHPTHIPRQNQFDRRHGYADLLRYPRRYKMHWRLWNGGTTRILLWGDPQYVRRFAASTRLYDGEGFEVNEPLATKMQDQPHDEKPFDLLGEKYRYYDWEFERYWHFFQVFGRVGYNPDTPPEVWRREFEHRFGKAAAPHVERGLHLASRILPRITACIFPYGSFPTTRGWAEMQPRGGDLAAYARAGVGDTQQFLTVQEAAELLVAGEESPKTSPQQTSDWFARTAEDVLRHAAEAEKRIGKHRTRELDSTIVDLRILAHLGRYHSRRIPAALAWTFFDRTRDLHCLDEAIRHERLALEAWGDIVAAAGDVYHADLRFGRRAAGLSGHWRDVLVTLQKSLADLQKKRDAFRPDGRAALRVVHVPLRRAVAGEAVAVHATAWGKKPIAEVRLAWRGGEGSPARRPMARAAEWLYSAAIPGKDVARGLAYRIEAVDADGRVAACPAADGAFAAVEVTRDSEPPTVRHTPIVSAPASKPLKIAAEVTDPAGVKWVRIRYRGVNQQFDYRALDMKPTGRDGRYEAEIPAAHVEPQWDFMYFIEAMDGCGNGRIHPDLEQEAPYVVVRLRREAP